MTIGKFLKARRVILERFQNVFGPICLLLKKLNLKKYTYQGYVVPVYQLIKNTLNKIYKPVNSRLQLQISLVSNTTHWPPLKHSKVEQASFSHRGPKVPGGHSQ